jgi:hypothetical protein
VAHPLLILDYQKHFFAAAFGKCVQRGCHGRAISHVALETRKIELYRRAFADLRIDCDMTAG